MGTWGYELFSDDQALDVRDAYRQLIRDQPGIGDREAAREILGEVADEDVPSADTAVAWVALAACQSELGRLDAAVTARAVQIVDSGAGLAGWEPHAVAGRRAVLAAVRAQLTGPQPARQNIPLPRPTSLQPGDVLAYRTAPGSYVLLRVARIYRNEPVCALLDYAGPQIPAVADIAGLADYLWTDRWSPGGRVVPFTMQALDDVDYPQAGYVLIGSIGARAPRTVTQAAEEAPMALADTVTAYVTAALSGSAEYPPEVLREETLEEAAAVGRSLLVLLDPAAQPDLAGPLAYLTADPESVRARKTVRHRLRRILASAPQLAADAQQLTAQFTARVTGSGDADAITDLGYLLSQLGDESGAEDAYRAAAALGSADAMASLGHLRLGKRDIAGARAIFENAITSGTGDIALAATLEMGRLHLMTGDDTAARVAYQQVIDSGHPRLAAEAMSHLAHLLSRRGDPGQARVLFQRVASTSHPRDAQAAAHCLADLLAEQGDTSGAIAAYQQIIDTGDTHEAEIAMIDLLNLLRDQGDADATRGVSEQALATGNAEAGYSLTVLGQILREHGDSAGARAAFQQAIDIGHTDALVDLTGLLRDQHDIPGLQAAHQQALDHGDRRAAEAALQSLAWVHHQEHDNQAARATLVQRLRETKDQQSRRRALADLRRLTTR